ncbi:antibiotic biosynthesis monooxygenase [Vibrio astriarenae]|uniref:Antibiotic biosynthesis monooxygenase n=1 Tax=Vibrio astriarenae TaxID=1481923 RepID=A0A7Z2T700_9VIBR|nr:antibiotic biosynthesis monooxygenase [Vibrio astriarenae]QIA65544.1 antibiotic biosynthesis monooxygenase [Vibrio astriarenae]
MTKVILQGSIEIPAACYEQVLRELPEHIRLTRQETGCLVFKVEPCSENRYRYSVYEEFSSPEAFEAHQERVRHSVWGQVTTHVKRDYQITEGSV